MAQLPSRRFLTTLAVGLALLPLLIVLIYVAM